MSQMALMATGPSGLRKEVALKKRSCGVLGLANRKISNEWVKGAGLTEGFGTGCVSLGGFWGAN
jgi:hypothetical protein